MDSPLSSGALFLFDVSNEVPQAILLKGRDALLKEVESLKAKGRMAEAAALEATVPRVERVVQQERWLDWTRLPAELESSNRKLLPFPKWSPAYQMNMKDFAATVDSLLMRMLILPHAVYTSHFF